MVAKKYAISAPSAAIALRYGKNVSKGIQEMEKRLESYRNETWNNSGPSARKLK